MDPITVQMTALHTSPFIFPSPHNVNEVVAPLGSAKYLDPDNTTVLLRVIQFTNEDLATAPTLEIKGNGDNQLTAIVNFETSEGSLNDKPNIAWYGEVEISVEQGMPVDADQITADAVDGGRPPKTSRGTVIVIQPNLD